MKEFSIILVPEEAKAREEPSSEVDKAVLRALEHIRKRCPRGAVRFDVVPTPLLDRSLDVQIMGVMGQGVRRRVWVHMLESGLNVAIRQYESKWGRR